MKIDSKKILYWFEKKINAYLSDLKNNDKLFEKLEIDNSYGLNSFKDVELDTSKRSFIKSVEASNIKINENEISSEWFDSPAKSFQKINI